MDPTSIRVRIAKAIGKLPGADPTGYRLEGSFTRREGTEETTYRAVVLRTDKGWTAELTNTDPALRVSFGANGFRGWASSPEGTVHGIPERLPYCARYDFPTLARNLLQLLEQTAPGRSPEIARQGNDLYIRGNLQNGDEATFYFNGKEYLPRKVSIHPRIEPACRWLNALLESDGAVSTVPEELPSGTPFEIWFSNPIILGGFRIPQRTDYFDGGEIRGTFQIERLAVAPESDPPSEPALGMRWQDGLRFRPAAEEHHTSLYFDSDGLMNFRRRLESAPWSEWGRMNAQAARFLSFGSALSPLFPGVPTPRIIVATAFVFLLIMLILTFRIRRAQWKKTSWLVLGFGFILCFWFLAAGFTSRWLAMPVPCSLSALQAAIRFAASGSFSDARLADAFLRRLGEGHPPETMLELSQLCQAFALTYDLISPALPRNRQIELEFRLFELAKPLYGGLQGVRSSKGAGAVMAAGLGMAGLTIRHEPYVSSARATLRKSFARALDRGVHTEGPGSGASSMNSAANLMFALKRAGLTDLYGGPFEDYLRSTIDLLSPVATLPLFGETGIDDARQAVSLLLKSANHIPEDLAGQACALWELYWTHGQHSPTGWKRLALPLWWKRYAFFNDPYVLFQYEQTISSRPPASGASALVGGGQAVVLRSGNASDALYLAVNTRPAWRGLRRRDFLSFDLYAYKGLLASGSGYVQPPEGPENGNTVGFDGQGQRAGQPSGIAFTLINQKQFDLVRVLADKIYDLGRFQRDIVMVRPEESAPGYFILVDEIHPNAPETSVQWNLLGRGPMVLGFDMLSSWSTAAFAPLGTRGTEVKLFGCAFAPQTSASRRQDSIRGHEPFFDQEANSLVLQWDGPRRLAMVLYPVRSGEADPKFARHERTDGGQIGDTDWLLLGDLSTRIRIGPITLAGEYTLVRDRKNSLPAILLVQGFELQVGAHSFKSSKPVTLSLDGLSGGILTHRPDTEFEIRSPSIKRGDSFSIDGTTLAAEASGRLRIPLASAGLHILR